MDITPEVAADLLHTLCDMVDKIEEDLVAIKHSSYAVKISSIDADKKAEILNEYDMLMVEMFNELNKIQSAYNILMPIVKG